MNNVKTAASVLAVALVWTSGYLYAQRSSEGGRRGWTPGKGYGWVWGKNDEVGALNTLTDADRLAALRLAPRRVVHSGPQILGASASAVAR